MLGLRWAAILGSCALLQGHALAAAGDLPSPDAMTLGARHVPRALVEGYRIGVEQDAVERFASGRVPAAELPAVRVRARNALSRALDEAFPPDLLSGLAAQFFAASYTADELRALRVRLESPLDRKQRSFERSEAEIVADTPESWARAREQLARETFDEEDRKELEAFVATPLGKKVVALGPALAGFYVDALDRHWRAVRSEFEPRLRAAVEAALAAP